MKRNLLPMGVVIAFIITALYWSVPARAAQQDQPQPPKIIRKSGGVLQGSATRRVEPVYPPLAKTAEISGAVVVEITVDETGKVIAARAITGHPLLRDAAIEAARGWEFTPTSLQGTPVKVIGTITFNFNLNSSNTKEHIEKLKQEIATRPNDADLYFDLGSAYASSGELEAALQAYHQALALKPDYAKAWLGIGSANIGLRHPDEAIDAYKQFLQLAPDSPEADHVLLQIADIFYETQRYAEAVEAAKQAIAKRPTADRGHMVLASSYLKLGDKEAAMEQYRLLKDRQSVYAEELFKRINSQQ
jgi:TonB family protein